MNTLPVLNLAGDVGLEPTYPRSKRGICSLRFIPNNKMAPQDGFAPPTHTLTGCRSTAELLGNGTPDRT